MIGWRDEPTEDDGVTSSGCDDPELVRHAQRDTAAFTALFDCFWPLVYRYCYQRLRSWPDAEDAAQTAFLQAVTHLPGFEHRPESGGFRSWLLRIAHNETTSAARARLRKPSVPFPDEAFVDPAPDPADVATDLATNDWLAELCSKLPAEQRDVMLLRFAGLTTSEIARALKKNERAVQKSTERATARLRLLVRQEVGSHV
jgi:RNA polymerase sigma factor (sigma-70 family)